MTVLNKLGQHVDVQIDVHPLGSVGSPVHFPRLLGQILLPSLPDTACEFLKPWNPQKSLSYVFLPLGVVYWVTFHRSYDDVNTTWSTID